MMDKKLFWLIFGLVGISVLLAGCEPIDEYDESADSTEFDDDEFLLDDETAEFEDDADPIEAGDEEFEFEDDEFEFEDEEFSPDDEFPPDDETNEFDDIDFELPDIEACRLVDNDDDPTGGLGFPVSDQNAPGTGTVRIKVLFADFSDAPATMEPAEILEEVEKAGDLFHAMSYGRVTLQFEPIDNWYRLSQPSENYLPEDIDTMIEETIVLADPDVDFSDIDIVYVMASDAIDYDSSFYVAMYGTYADGVELINGNGSSEDYTDPEFHKTVAHELGHSFGLVDLYEYNSDDTHRFAGDFDLMGNLWGRAPELMAYHRWMLGWLDDEQIYCQQEEDQTVFLTPIETEGDTKAVMVPLGDNQLLVVESRRALGYDSEIYEPGALVYEIDANASTGEGGIVVHPDAGYLKEEAPLSPGETVTVQDITITVLEADDEGDLVQVTINYEE